MKKIHLLLCLTFIILLCSCATYKGDKIEKLVYKEIDYNGGYTTSYIFNFIDNKYKIEGYLPGHEESNRIISEGMFEEDAETTFINGINKCGLLRIKDEYNTLMKIIDGGGWNLEISFDSGKTITSIGKNASPGRIFNKCAIYFYDLCGIEVMGNIDKFLINPDNLSISLIEKKSSNSYKEYFGMQGLMRANYKWNNKSFEDADIYELNENSTSTYDLNSSFKINFDTENIKLSHRFKKFTLKSYDFNSELSNEEVLYEKKWFKRLSVDIEVNKIYVYTLEYKNGNYVSYTFSIKG